MPRTDILIESNLLTGVVAAAVFSMRISATGARPPACVVRLRTIADMNHHIRNALQIITYAASARKRDDSVEMIRTSVYGLSGPCGEVLPGYAPAPDNLRRQPTAEPQASTHAG